MKLTLEKEPAKRNESDKIEQDNCIIKTKMDFIPTPSV